jgi:RNA polymerase sigma-70 factor (ECF subfamily)
MYGNQDENLARELVQMVFVRVWEKRKKMAGVKSMEDFLFILARNTIYNYFRTERRISVRERVYQSNREEEQNDTDHPLLAKEYSRILQNAIDQLPPQQRKIYVLAKQEGLNYREIASRLSLTRSTIQTHVKLGTRSIQRFLDRHLAQCMILAVTAREFLR